LLGFLHFNVVATSFHANDVSEISSNKNQPLISVSQLPTSASQFLTSANQPLTSASKPLTSVSQPLASVSQPLTSINQPLTLESRHLASTTQPLTTVSQPITSISQPITSISQPTTSANQPVKESSFEFGDFQGSSTEQPADTSTSENNWASFGNGFSSNEAGLVAFSMQNTTMQESFTTTITSNTTNTTITTAAAATTTSSGSSSFSNIYTSGPGHFAVFDEVNFPPTSTYQPVSNETNVVSHSGDKYSAFDVVRLNAPIAGTAGNEDSEFGQFEMGQPPTNSQGVVKLEHYSTQVRNPRL